MGTSYKVIGAASQINKSRSDLTPVKYALLLIAMPQLNKRNREVKRGKNFTGRAPVSSAGVTEATIFS